MKDRSTDNRCNVQGIAVSQPHLVLGGCVSVDDGNLRVSKIDRDLIVDRIYEIALEPTALDNFIDFWHDHDLASYFSDPDIGVTAESDEAYKIHLERAQAILQRSEITSRDLSDYLAPYENLAAFIVSGALKIEAANRGAQAVFGMRIGDAADQIELPYDARVALLQAARDVMHRTGPTEKLLKADLESKGGALLFRVLRLPSVFEDGPAALIVSTQFHWSERIGVLLGSAFHLTNAEQNVVKLLVEGHDAKSISSLRKTSEGTVRGQIKSITSKMNVRSQTDIVRVVMSLGEFPKGPAGEEAIEVSAPSLSNNWLEAEVWKPFKSVKVPDGRTLTYHDMGPPSGNPVLYTHTGSCLTRWPRSMIRLAFEKNLRIVCPIRPGYGHSDNLDSGVDPIAMASQDTLHLLASLNIQRLPYIAHGTDLPMATHFAALHPNSVSSMIGIGAFPPLPGNGSIACAGRWQRFFVATARNAPHLVFFASKAVMAMAKRIGPEAMLRQLCKEQPSDLALLENEEMKQILCANISLMAGKSTNAARAFASEYIAFQKDWSDQMMATRKIPMRLFLAEEDPTIDLALLPDLQDVYPWISFEIVKNAGLAMMFQNSEMLIPIFAEAAKARAHSH